MRLVREVREMRKMGGSRKNCGRRSESERRASKIVCV